MKFEVADFQVPGLNDVACAIQDRLETNYEIVDVAIVDCPDLTSRGVASVGLGGATALFEFGGEPYAHNPAFRGRNVSILDMSAASGSANAKFIGAGMADTAAIGGNCGELVPNVDPKSQNLSQVARVGKNRECIVEHYDSLSCGAIANLFCSEGEPGKVIQIDVRKRIGAEPSLPQAIRSGLATIVDGDGHIGMGGVFEVLAGQVRSHVMPNYACLPDGYYDTEKEAVVREFLQFYEHMGPGLIAFCTLWTGDPTGGSLHLRGSGEHTHFYHRDAAAQQAGHYHGDVSPDDVHYSGYFSLAERVFRFGDVYEELGISP